MSFLNSWTVKKKDHAFMRSSQAQERVKGMTHAERWFHNEFLSRTRMKWTYQSQWGFRLFDFWNASLGVAVEVDGFDRNEALDLLRDEKEWDRSKIVVFRVRNFNRRDGELFLDSLRRLPSWKARRGQS